MHHIARLLTLAALTAAAVGCAPAEPVPVNPVVREIAGRTAGEARRCVPIVRNEPLRLAEGQTQLLVFGNGRTVWLNRLRHDCTGLRRDDILVVEPAGAQYCRGDRVRSLDPVSRIAGAACLLGDFVPYTR